MKKKDRRKLKSIAYHMAQNHDSMIVGMGKALVNAEKRNKDKKYVAEVFSKAIGENK